MKYKAPLIHDTMSIDGDSHEHAQSNRVFLSFLSNTLFRVLCGILVHRFKNKRKKMKVKAKNMTGERKKYISVSKVRNLKTG